MPLFKVEGMTCDHCVRAVTEAVHRTDPSATVQVNLDAGQVRIDSQAPAARLAEAIRAEGYDVPPVAA